QTYGNSFDPGSRTFGIVLPNTFAGAAGRGGAAVGNQNFSTANDPHYEDPQTQQWSLSLDRETGLHNACRLTSSGRPARGLTRARLDLTPQPHAPAAVRFAPEYTRGRVTPLPDRRFTATLIWELPFFKGNTALGGWTLSSIVTAQSGYHLTALYSSHCGSGTNCYNPEKADAVSGPDPNRGPKTTDKWFNTAAFSNSAFFNAAGQPIFAGRFGNAQKGNILRPGLYTIDMGLLKDF